MSGFNFASPLCPDVRMIVLLTSVHKLDLHQRIAFNDIAAVRAHVLEGSAYQ